MKYTKEKIESALKASKGIVADAAKIVGLSAANFYTHMKKHGIEAKEKGVYASNPKILVFDIETAPMQVYAWDLWKQDIPISAIIKDWYVLCWSAKWLDDKNVMSDSLCNYKEYKNGNDCEFDVIASIWHLLNECDIAVAHNGKAFDKKKLNAKFFQYGLPEPNYKLVDTMLIAKGNFALTSNKLDYITKMAVVGGEGKLQTDFSLWKGCMNGDKDSWKKMVSYCERDVFELEKVYKELRGWDKYAPVYGVYVEESDCCNVCGSDQITWEKDIVTSTQKFELFRCADCGHYQRSRKSISKTTTMVNVQ